MNTYLEFEKPIEQLDNKVHELKSLNDNAPSDNLLEEITQVEEQINETYKKIYSSISPWQRTLVARHPQRPKTREYIQNLIEDFFPLSGDRFFSEDSSEEPPPFFASGCPLAGAAAAGACFLSGRLSTISVLMEK